MPVPSLGWDWPLLHSGLLCAGGEEVLALAGRIPARVSGRRVAQRALPDWHVLVRTQERLPASHTLSLPGSISVSLTGVSTWPTTCTYTAHTRCPHSTPQLPHRHVFHSHDTPCTTVHKQNIPGTQPHNTTPQLPLHTAHSTITVHENTHTMHETCHTRHMP